MKRVFYFTAMLFCCSSFQVKGQNADYQNIINQFGDQLEKDVAEDRLGSISAAVVINGKLVWSKAFGYADPVNKIPADTSTIYRIASVSKTFTVFLMMQMAEAGYFNLDDPIEGFVPEIRGIKGYSDADKITFRQLASHTAGLQKEPGLKNAAVGPVEGWEDKLLMAIPATKLLAKPGSKFHYSNIGISILGLAISRAVREPFTDLIKRNILAPLCMENSFYKLPVTDSGRLSLGVYGNRLNKRSIRIPYSERTGRGYKVPAGGVLSTPNDLTKFMLAVMGKSEKKIINDESLLLMETLVSQEKSDLYYGLGLYINKTDSLTIIGHGGRAWGYRALFCFDPVNNNGLVLMRNYDKGKINFDFSAASILNQLARKNKQ